MHVHLRVNCFYGHMYKVHIVIIIAITVQLAEQQCRNTSIHKTLTAHYHENYTINSGCSEVEINIYWDNVFV